MGTKANPKTDSMIKLKINFKRLGISGLIFLALSVSILSFQNCGKSGFHVEDSGGFDFASLSTAPCSFNGRLIASGSAVDAFTAVSVRHGLSCQDIKERRVCLGGSLSGSYEHDSCSIELSTSPICSFQGVTYAEGQSVLMYQASVAGNGSCVAETRTCRNGSLTGSYTASSCRVATGSDCQISGQWIANGSALIRFSASSVSVGKKCSDVKRTLTCVNGSVSDIASYPYTQCSAKEASANTRCQVSAPTCPYDPGHEGLWWTDDKMNDPIYGTDRESCLSLATLSNSCDSQKQPAVTATFFVAGAEVAKKTQGYYCQIYNPTCPYQPESQGTFRDSDTLATTDSAACLGRAEYWVKTCGSTRSTATFVRASDAGLVMQSQRSYPQ